MRDPGSRDVIVDYISFRANETKPGWYVKRVPTPEVFQPCNDTQSTKFEREEAEVLSRWKLAAEAADDIAAQAKLQQDFNCRTGVIQTLDAIGVPYSPSDFLGPLRKRTLSHICA